MVELAIGPSGDGMASVASRRRRGKACGDVVGHIAAQRLRFVPIGRMAGHAIG